MLKILSRLFVFSVVLSSSSVLAQTQAPALGSNAATVPVAPAAEQVAPAASAPAAVVSPAPAPVAPSADQPAPAAASSNLAPTQAAAPEVKATKFEDWYLRCVTPADAKVAQCEVAQISQVKDNGKDVQILTMAFAMQQAPAADKAKPAAPVLVMTTVVPLNMFLPAGLILLDGKKELKKLAYRNCNQAGCWTQSVADEAFVKDLSSGKDVTARMQLMTGQNINLKFSVTGLSAALGEMRKPAK